MLIISNAVIKINFAALQCVSDLVQGELMQLGSKETENERFAHYLSKNYRKTASLMANCIKAVSGDHHYVCIIIMPGVVYTVYTICIYSHYLRIFIAQNS